MRGRPNKQHRDLLQDPQYKLKKEKHIKVRIREQEEKDAEDQIREFHSGNESIKDYRYEESGDL